MELYIRCFNTKLKDGLKSTEKQKLQLVTLCLYSSSVILVLLMLYFS